MIHFVWSRRQLGGDAHAISRVIDQQVDIRRKTYFFQKQGPPESGWTSIRAELIDRATRYRDVSNSLALEDDCWQLLAPCIEPAPEDTWPRSWQHRARPYKCWSHDWSDGEPSVIDIHIENAYPSESPFRAHMADFAATLLQLLLDACDRHSEVRAVRCSSWLNEFPPFLDLFPTSWRTSVVPSETCGANWGWWGQYMTHEGGFHERNAAILRDTGRHPYQGARAQCDIDEAIAHLRKV